MGKNTKNLKSLADRSPEERTEIARKAGTASGQKRREIKRMKESLALVLSAPLDDVFDMDVVGELEKAGVPESLWTAKMEIAVALVRRARTGDPRSVELLLRLIGETPTDLSEHRELGPDY